MLSSEYLNFGIQIIGFFVTILVAFITAFFTSKNSQEKLTKQHFKEQGVSTQECVLKFWNGLFMGNFDIIKVYNDLYEKRFDYKTINEKQSAESNILSEIQKDSFIFCSRSTIKALGDYMQYTFSKKKREKSVIPVVLIARIVCKMKYDFTGEKTFVLDLMRIKINDLTFMLEIKIFIILLWYNFKNFLY